MIDYNVIMLDKMKTEEAVVVNEDGSYTIFINDNLHPDKKRSAATHALKHIENGDFDKPDIQRIESNTHCYQVDRTSTKTKTAR